MVARDWHRFLDDLCRDVVMWRDDWKCLRCGKPAYRSETTGKLIGLDWSHVYSRNNWGVRWDLDNSKALCKGCHLWWHHNPVDAVEWWKEKLGEKAYRSLILRKNTSTGKQDYIAIKLYLEDALEKFKRKTGPLEEIPLP